MVSKKNCCQALTKAVKRPNQYIYFWRLDTGQGRQCNIFKGELRALRDRPLAGESPQKPPSITSPSHFTTKILYHLAFLLSVPTVFQKDNIYPFTVVVLIFMDLLIFKERRVAFCNRVAEQKPYNIFLHNTKKVVSAFLKSFILLQQTMLSYLINLE